MAPLNILYQNVRGLRTKTNDFFRNVLGCNSDIICIIKTWLLPGVNDAELFDDRYVVYRCDRDYSTRIEEAGGGVLIAVRRGIVVSNMTIYPSNDRGSADEVSICITLSNNIFLHISCCYFLKCSTQIDDEKIFYDRMSDLILSNSDDYFLFVGDFNIRHASWLLCDVQCINLINTRDLGDDQLVANICDFLKFNGLKQYNLIKNINNRQLDLVKSNFDRVVYRSFEPLIKEDAHHPTLGIVLTGIHAKLLRSNSRFVRLFRSCNYDVVNQALSRVDWDECFSDLDFNCAVNEFYKGLNNLISDLIPGKIVRENNRYPI